MHRLIGHTECGKGLPEMLFTGCDVSAERALALGLVSQVTEMDELEAAGKRIADAMLATAPLGLRLTKQCFNTNLDALSFEAAIALEDRNQVILGRTADFREGVEAFKQKRPPVYTGR